MTNCKNYNFDGNKNMIRLKWDLKENVFFKLRFTPYKTEQPLQDMELQEKEPQKLLSIEEIPLERTYSY